MTSKKTALRAALAHIERLHPGWHCWTSDTGHLYATSTRESQWNGTGTTLDAGDANTPAELEARIEAAETGDPLGLRLIA